MFGLLNINKPEGITSFDVIAKLRKITGIKQIGHAGTLDPFATGVLPICIGKATKLIEYFPSDKEYLATIQFGISTTTYDSEGEITQKSEHKVTRKEVIEHLKNFKGEISQIPPIYSAIKVKGKKLYEYAREGKSIDIQPRKVNVYNIELKNFNEKLQQAEILVSCSKGTYIRSIANDLGKNLGCGAYLVKLKRTKAGEFSIKDSHTLEEISSDIKQYIINPLDVIELKKIYLDDNQHEKILHGMSINSDTKNKNGDIVFLVYGDKISGIGMINNSKILVKKVFEVL